MLRLPSGDRSEVGVAVGRRDFDVLVCARRQPDGGFVHLRVPMTDLVSVGEDRVPHGSCGPGSLTS
jgi:hypothetical protein